ncbi:MAG: P-II family nitrogen regulator [Epulopiscium sp.]|nr:P-II family nitrogen regulator [Candidatus Epulonipiscium sp.]
MVDIIAICAIVERGKADHIVDCAKESGAPGATILYGRGTGEHEAKKIFNLHIDSLKEVIIIITDKSKQKDIYDAMVKAGNLKEPGAGIIFTVPVENLLGLRHRDQF